MDGSELEGSKLRVAFAKSHSGVRDNRDRFRVRSAATPATPNDRCRLLIVLRVMCRCRVRAGASIVAKTGIGLGTAPTKPGGNSFIVRCCESKSTLQVTCSAASATQSITSGSGQRMHSSSRQRRIRSRVVAAPLHFGASVVLSGAR
jgi:hypothetical protein